MYRLLGGALLCAALTGCAGMNSDFDCNKTTTDQCLSMADASKLAAKGRSLDDLSVEKDSVPKPAGEALATLPNSRPAVSSDRKVSVATLAPRPVMSAPVVASGSVPRTASVPVRAAPVTPSDYASAGRVNALRIPDATQRLWIAPWVDEQDSFHQPAVVEFVKKKSRWDEDFHVISEGE